MRQDNMPEPAAHIYPSDLERFKESETFGHCYSVAVGNPSERSVPLFTLSDVVAYAEQRVREEREQIAAMFKPTTKWVGKGWISTLSPETADSIAAAIRGRSA